MPIKNLYLVLVKDHPKVSINGIELKPTLPKGIAGYAPIYSNKKMAKKDWPNREIKIIRQVNV